MNPAISRAKLAGWVIHVAARVGNSLTFTTVSAGGSGPTSNASLAGALRAERIEEALDVLFHLDDVTDINAELMPLLR
jgi:hypothetical protein